MDESRATLRQYLIRRPSRPTSGEQEGFPRSRLMRAVLDPDKRRLWIAAATLSAVLFPQLLHVGRVGRLVSRYRHFGRFLSSLRT